MRVRGIDHVVVKVSDVERSLEWYGGLLGLAAEQVDEWRAGDAPFPSVRVSEGFIIDLLPSERSGENYDHLCLVIDNDDMAAVAADERFDVVAGPVVRGGARGDGVSVYVRDPDGNLVELKSHA
ncbi:MAG: VOC family virulence protein [Ilumatobacter sp.]|nr:VOC family virulence protein [Ilumatobacter sp.]